MMTLNLYLKIRTPAHMHNWSVLHIFHFIVSLVPPANLPQKQMRETF